MIHELPSFNQHAQNGNKALQSWKHVLKHFWK